jgi:hypothetical protein
MRSTLLVGRFAAPARYLALLGFIHGSKSSLALTPIASVIAISASIRNHDAPPV